MKDLLKQMKNYLKLLLLLNICLIVSKQANCQNTTRTDSLVCFTISEAAIIYEDLAVRRDSIDFLLEHCKVKEYFSFRQLYEDTKDSLTNCTAARREDIITSQIEIQKYKGQRNVLILSNIFESVLITVYLIFKK